MNEVVLSIEDPADGKQKHVGSKQLHDDGTLVWFRRISNEHVMRTGSFGVDAMTYDMHFAGKKGNLRVAYSGQTFDAPFDLFEKHRSTKDMGHGRQYFLAFAYWTEDVVAATVSPIKATNPKLVFGKHIPCPHCTSKSAKVQRECTRCGGTGVVTT